MAENQQRPQRKTREGVVVGDRMEKSVVVQVERKVQNPLYKKIIKRTKKYMADNPNNEAKYGDVVEITETRPLSKRKCWRVSKIIKPAIKKGE